jgi:peptidoglycan endopeptidase LytE
MNSKVNKVVNVATKHLGAPYERNAWLRDAPKVFNCSTFTRYVFRQVGIRLPPKAIKQAVFGRSVNPKRIMPADLIFIRGTSGFYDPSFPNGIGHVGIYVGDGIVISARNRGVTKESVSIFLKSDQYRVIRRII